MTCDALYQINEEELEMNEKRRRRIADFLRLHEDLVLDKRDVDYTLYLCTDRGMMRSPTIEEAVEQAILGGTGVIQLREKDIDARDFYKMAVRLKQITDRYSVPLIINDRVDIALACDAGGVHIGQRDIPAGQVRKMIGPQKLLGVSAATLEEAMQAVEDGADYLGIGAMYATGTKEDAQLVTISELKRIREAVDVPIVVIGGINLDTLDNFKGYGIDGLAVVSAVMAAENVEAAARELVTRFKE